MSPSSLPPSPSLEQLRRRAKELLKEARSGGPDAAARIREHHPEAAALSTYRLADAQLVIAREHGFPSWPKLKAYVDRVSGKSVFHPFRTDLSYYEERAGGFLSLVRQRLPEALALLRRHHPAYRDAEPGRWGISLDDAKRVLAAEHGFSSWDEFRQHLGSLEAGETAEPFLAAFQAMEAGDVEALTRQLDRHPDLIRAAGTNGNTLFNLALGVVMSGDHSRPPGMGAEAYARTLLGLLLSRGADVNAPNNRGWTPMHQGAYCGHPELVRGLLDAGGRTDLSAHGDGGTPLAQALFWGHREAAELLAEREVVPLNLRVAAGLGRTDLLAGLFEADGALKPEAGAHRAFYRPHSGFPVWEQKGDRREILDEALVWAATNGRRAAMAFLLERGADINGCPYRGTPLIAAAGKGDCETAAWLLDRGAEVNRRTVYGGTHHGRDVIALHPPAQHGDLEMCRLLLGRGADPNHPDALYHSPPWGWAAHFGEEALRDFILEYAWKESVFAAVATGVPDRLRAALAKHPEQVNDWRYWGTPLGLAVMKKNVELVRVLLNAGADPDLPGRDGRSPREAAEEDELRRLLTQPAKRTPAG